jgi:hypothetical protein
VTLIEGHRRARQVTYEFRFFGIGHDGTIDKNKLFFHQEKGKERRQETIDSHTGNWQLANKDISTSIRRFRN